MTLKTINSILMVQLHVVQVWHLLSLILVLLFTISLISLNISFSQVSFLSLSISLISLFSLLPPFFSRVRSLCNCLCVSVGSYLAAVSSTSNSVRPRSLCTNLALDLLMDARNLEKELDLRRRPYSYYVANIVSKGLTLVPEKW